MNINANDSMRYTNGGCGLIHVVTSPITVRPRSLGELYMVLLIFLHEQESTIHSSREMANARTCIWIYLLPEVVGGRYNHQKEVQSSRRRKYFPYIHRLYLCLISFLPLSYIIFNLFNIIIRFRKVKVHH